MCVDDERWRDEQKAGADDVFLQRLVAELSQPEAFLCGRPGDDGVRLLQNAGVQDLSDVQHRLLHDVERHRLRRDDALLQLGCGV